MVRTSFIAGLAAALAVVGTACLAATYTYSFENGTLQGWTADVYDDGGLPWHVVPSTFIAHTGTWSLEYYLHNLNDAQKVWIEKPFEVPMCLSGYSVVLTWYLASRDWGVANLWNVIASIGTRDPETYADFVTIGNTGNGDGDQYVWLPQQKYSKNLGITTAGEIWTALGIWGTWEVPRKYYVDDVSVKITPVHQGSAPIAVARSTGDGKCFIITPGYVTSGTADLEGRIYIEDPKRSCGIAVQTYETTPPLNRGTPVTVLGVLTTTADGERLVSVSEITVGATSPNDIKPVCMPNRTVGGSDGKPLPRGVTGSVGLNNVGLLVKTCGRVVYRGSDFFVIDDGSRDAPCGKAPVKGIAVAVTGLAGGGTIPMPADQSIVIVTGISSIFRDGGTGLYYPIIRPRAASDITEAVP